MTMGGPKQRRKEMIRKIKTLVLRWYIAQTLIVETELVTKMMTRSNIPSRMPPKLQLFQKGARARQPNGGEMVMTLQWDLRLTAVRTE